MEVGTGVEELLHDVDVAFLACGHQRRRVDLAIADIDAGAVVLKSKIPVGNKFPLPIDYLARSSENCEKLILRFLDLLENVARATDIPATEQEHDVSDYFPRLFTEQNGLIDWSWEAHAVERFIRAFSTPYPGAHSYYRGQKVEKKLENDEQKLMHV